MLLTVSPSLWFKNWKYGWDTACPPTGEAGPVAYGFDLGRFTREIEIERGAAFRVVPKPDPAAVDLDDRL